MDKTALSYWFPKLEAAGLPVPKTILIDMPKGAQECVWSAFDGKDDGDKQAMDGFIGEIAHACQNIGYPAFLRTDHTSDKHNWKRTCFITAESNLRHHVCALAEFSECAGMIGMPWSKWVVREFLPTIPLGICPHYGDMPLCREFRFFVSEGEVRCWHPYWPIEALEQGGADVALLDRLSSTDGYQDAFTLAHKTARAIEGAWSVDVLETRRGWYVTDMAEAHKSFHWEGCEHNSEMAHA